MNTQLLDQYNVKFTKVNTGKDCRYSATGGGMASYLWNIGRDKEEIQDALEKVTFFYKSGCWRRNVHVGKGNTPLQCYLRRF